MISILAESRWRRAFLATGRTFAPYAAACAVGLTAGAVAASSRPGLVAVFVGLFAAAGLALSRHALLWFIVIGGLVITGAAQLYAPELRYFKYVLPIVALILFMHAVMDHLSKPAERGTQPMPGMVPWAIAFIAVAMLSLVVNWDAGLAVLGIRDYFILWVLFFALVLARWKPGGLDLVPWAFLAIAFLQLPFAAHQLLVLVPLREGLGGGIVAVDIIAGTFGANMWGGGSNAVLSLFMFLVVACLIGLWKHGALSKGKALLLSLVLLSPVFFNEAKVSAIYLPVIFLVLFYRDIVHRPARFVAMAGIGFGVFALLMTALTVFHPSGELRKWSELVEVTFSDQTSHPEERRGQWSELTRWTAITFWASEHAGAHPLHTLLGHGPGASRVQDADGGIRLSRTLAETRYGGLRIGYTSISALLWDTGVLGLAMVLGLFAAAYRTATQLAAGYAVINPARAGLFDGLRAGIVLLVISLVHKDFFVFQIPYQTMVLLIFGYLVVSYRQLHQLRSEGKGS